MGHIKAAGHIKAGLLAKQTVNWQDSTKLDDNINKVDKLEKRSNEYVQNINSKQKSCRA